MITEQSLINFIEKLGHIPACPSLCIQKINNSPLNCELKFYVNPHNLCWYVDEEFLEFKDKNKYFMVNKLEVLFSTNVRDIKLSELL